MKKTTLILATVAALAAAAAAPAEARGFHRGTGAGLAAAGGAKRSHIFSGKERTGRVKVLGVDVACNAFHFRQWSFQRTLGGLFGLPVISQPNVGILGLGTIEKRPVVIDDAIAIRSMCYITLSYDHRVVDGAIAHQFLHKVKDTLENWSESVL